MNEPLYQTGSFVDHFRIVRPLGRGGMGEVYLARDTRLGRKAALKIIHPQKIGQEEAVERFLFEARTTARFSHPHIVTIYAVGEHEERPYLALEYLEGQTLRQRMGEEPLSVRETQRLGLAIAQALREAHRHQILHRDLKPENVLLPRDGRLRVVDFGLAKQLKMSRDPDDADAFPGPATGPMARLEASALLETPAADPLREDTDSSPGLSSGARGVRGTPAYMSPEQWGEQAATPASDVWALGVILFEMLAGRRPYEDRYAYAIAMRVCNDEPVPDIEELREVPGKLADLVSGCLQKNPADRLTVDQVVEGLEALQRGRRGKRTDSDSPFRGLLPFSERHADLFFGREAELGALVERLRSEPVLAVVGPSGAGKSSFVKAGVIPRLREQGRWLVLSMRPGSHPFETLAARLAAGTNQRSEQVFTSPRVSGDHIPVMGVLEEALAAGVPEPGSSEASRGDARQLAKTLAKSPNLLSLQLQKLAEASGSRVLIYVDQLEELYTLVDDERTRQRFMEALQFAADDPLEPVRVIVSLRDDFLGRLAEGSAARETLSRVAVVRSPEQEGLTEILVKPLEAVGYSYEDPGLVEEMLEAVRGEPACLPLLQFTCHELWSRRDRGRQTIFRKAYEVIGGVAGALARHADGVLSGLPPDRLELARQLLLRLVTAESTRKVLPLAELVDGLARGAREVVEHLVANRLVSVRRSGGLEGDAAELELVHESLIHSWTRLARWLDEGREDRALLEELGQTAELWERRGRRPEEVWDGPAVQEARRKLARCTEEIPARVRRFLEASEKEAQRTQRRRRVLRGVAILTLVVSAVISAVVAAVIHRQSVEVKRQRDQATTARQREAQKRAESDRESASAALARQQMLQARAKVRSSLERQDDPLTRALWARINREPLLWKRELSGYAHHAMFSPDGHTLAVASDRTVYLFDTRTLAMRALRGHPASAMWTAFSPDGKTLAVAYFDGQVWLWRHRDAKVLRRLRGHKGPVWSVRFDRQGKAVVTASSDRTVREWDVATGRSLQVYRGHTGACTGASFSPDGRWVASASYDGTVRLWRRGAAVGHRILASGKVGLSSVSFIPGGNGLAAGGLDGVMRFWRLSDGALLRRLAGHSSRVNAVVLSPDGKLLASPSADRTVRLWDARSGRSLSTLRGHTAAVWSASFSPDGKTLVSAAIDRTIRVTSVPVAIRVRPSTAHDLAVMGAAFSPDGKLLATATYHDTVQLWNVSSGRLLQVLRGHEGDVYDVAFSPDGRQLASAAADRTVRLWDVRTGAMLKVLRHPKNVRVLAFNPRRPLLAVGSADRTVHLWDLDKLVRRAVLRGLEQTLWAIAFDPGGRLLATGNYRGDVRLWDAETGKPLRRLGKHAGNVIGLQFSADGRSLVTGSWDKTIRQWNVATGQWRLVARYTKRVNRLSVSPDGRTVAAPLGSGDVMLQPMSGGKPLVLRGHRKEANVTTFSPDGRLVATTSDDGSLRVWRRDTGLPQWYVSAVLTRPVRVRTHRGWERPGAASGSATVVTPWMRHLNLGVRLAAGSPDGRYGCVVTTDHHLERWQIRPPRRLTRTPLAGAMQVLALPGGCVVRCKEGARFVDPAGKVRTLVSQSKGLSWSAGELLVVGPKAVHRFDGAGRVKAPLAAASGVTAAARIGTEYALGFGDGNIELVERRGRSHRRSLSLEQVPPSPVERILAGPMGTIAVGYANGTVGLWSLKNGRLLDRLYVHGPVRYLLREGARLVAVSELGDHRVMDLSVFHMDYCKLLRIVWRQVPLTWDNGIPVPSPMPKGHRCCPKR